MVVVLETGQNKNFGAFSIFLENAEMYAKYGFIPRIKMELDTVLENAKPYDADILNRVEEIRTIGLANGMYKDKNSLVNSVLKDIEVGQRPLYSIIGDALEYAGAFNWDISKELGPFIEEYRFVIENSKNKMKELKVKGKNDFKFSRVAGYCALNASFCSDC